MKAQIFRNRAWANTKQALLAWMQSIAFFQAVAMGGCASREDTAQQEEDEDLPLPPLPVDNGAQDLSPATSHSGGEHYDTPSTLPGVQMRPRASTASQPANPTMNAEPNNR